MEQRERKSKIPRTNFCTLSLPLFCITWHRKILRLHLSCVWCSRTLKKREPRNKLSYLRTETVKGRTINTRERERKREERSEGKKVPSEAPGNGFGWRRRRRKEGNQREFSLFSDGSKWLSERDTHFNIMVISYVTENILTIMGDKSLPQVITSFINNEINDRLNFMKMSFSK